MLIFSASQRHSNKALAKPEQTAVNTSGNMEKTSANWEKWAAKWAPSPWDSVEGFALYPASSRILLRSHTLGLNIPRVRNAPLAWRGQMTQTKGKELGERLGWPYFTAGNHGTDRLKELPRVTCTLGQSQKLNPSLSSVSCQCFYLRLSFHCEKPQTNQALPYPSSELIIPSVWQETERRIIGNEICQNSFVLKGRSLI